MNAGWADTIDSTIMFTNPKTNVTICGVGMAEIAPSATTQAELSLFIGNLGADVGKGGISLDQALAIIRLLEAYTG